MTTTLERTPKLETKLPAVGTTIFTVMSTLAAEKGAVNLGQGFPDFECDPQLVNAVTGAMTQGLNQYPPMTGVPVLREAISAKVAKLYGHRYDANSEITITAGATQGILTAILACVHPGDEVIVLDPCYDSYIPNIEINGAKAVRINLVFPEYKIDWSAVREKITANTKAILINSPHNPTGSVLTENDIEELRNIVRNTNIFIVSDEVYEHLIFDNLPHLSMLLYPDLLERSFVCFSFGKVYHCTGWKLGYCIAPAELTKEFRKVHQFNCFTCHTPSQVGLTEFLKNEDAYLSLGKFLQQKRDHFIDLMKQTRFDLLHSSGSYFICGTYKKISNESDKDLAIRLTKEAGVALIPVSAFYQDAKDDNVLRFCFAKKNETLEAAVEKLAKI